MPHRNICFSGWDVGLGVSEMINSRQIRFVVNIVTETSLRYS
jgi:hypothetical protein